MASTPLTSAFCYTLPQIQCSMVVETTRIDVAAKSMPFAADSAVPCRKQVLY